MEEKLCSFYRKLNYQSIGRETLQFYGKLTSNQSIGKKFYGKLTSNQCIGKETLQSYGKLTSNQSIGRETMQFLWEIDF